MWSPPLPLEIATSLQILYKSTSLPGLLLSEERTPLFQDVLKHVRHMWGPGSVHIVPHSADAAALLSRVDTVAARRTGDRRCILLPNAHFHAPALLEAIFRLLCPYGQWSGVFVATFHPREGLPHPILVDRTGVCLLSPDQERRRDAAKPVRPAGPESTAPPSARASTAAPPALATLSHVGAHVPDHCLRLLSQAAIRLQLTGHRGELFAVEFARTRAAGAGRKEVDESDVRCAIDSVLTWRSRAGESPASRAERGFGRMNKNEAEQFDAAAPSPPAGTEPGGSGGGDQSASLHSQAGGSGGPGSGADPAGQNGLSEETANGGVSAQSLAIDGALPPDNGNSCEAYSEAAAEPVKLPAAWRLVSPRRRGPHEPGSLRRETAPRRVEPSPRGRGRSQISDVTAPGTPDRLVQTHREGSRVDWHATLLAAAPWRAARQKSGSKTWLRPQDLRFRLRSQPAELLYIAVLDTSASMMKYRIGKAKGLVLSLLARAGGERAAVAVITCGGDVAKIVVRPTRSTVRTRAAVSRLTVGGGTPLADGLAKADRIAKRFDPNQRGVAHVIVFTDGGANTLSGLSAEADPGERRRRLEDSLVAECRNLRARNAHVLLVDTKGTFAAGGRGAALARLMDASYASLNRLEVEVEVRRGRRDGIER